MNAFELLSDPVRRRVVELLAEGERGAGEITGHIRAEFQISQPAVSNQLRVLREAGVARSERHGSRRLYALQPTALTEVTAWVERYTGLWTNRLDALGTEVARGKRQGVDCAPRRDRPEPDRQRSGAQPELHPRLPDRAR